jgi:hypothetical protein
MLLLMLMQLVKSLFLMILPGLGVIRWLLTLLWLFYSFFFCYHYVAFTNTVWPPSLSGTEAKGRLRKTKLLHHLYLAIIILGLR